MNKVLRTISIYLLIATTTALIGGCKDDDLVKISNIVEGQPITVNMKLSANSVKDIVVSTRADDTSDLLNNLRIYVYDSNGNFQQTVDVDLSSITPNTINGNVFYPVSFETTSGVKNLLVMGNRGGGFWTSSGTVDPQTYSFDGLRNLLLDLNVTLDSNGEIGTPIQITSSDQMLITGWNSNVVFDTSGNASAADSEYPGDNGAVVKIKRSMAHVTFQIAAKSDNARGTFTPTSYKVYNVPVGSFLSNMDNTQTPVNEDTSEEIVAFKNFATTNIPTASGGLYTFDFYMPENIYSEVGSITDYQDRDKWTGTAGSLPENKSWTNAPQTSTFVVISGTYSGSATVGNDVDESVTGNVSYTIHLGDFSDSGSMGNFSVERNVSYTYNVSVLGVDNIIVEASTNKEDQPGAEGQIYDNTSTVYSYNLDAHYEQVFLEYNLSNIATSIKNSFGEDLSDDKLDEAIANQLILVIQSEAMDHTADGVVNKRGSLKPYQLYADAVRNGKDPATAKSDILDGAGSNSIPTKGFDYKWIEFWPQTDNDIAVYPGTPTWSQSYIADVTDPTSTTDVDKLMDVYDVVVAMGKAVKDIYRGNSISTGSTNNDGIIISESESSYVARFTAFVNEYYYYTHPLTGEALTTWSVITNKIAREMIIAMSTDVSMDGNSSYSNIYSYISQLSMQTFYNSRVTSLNAFGIETYNETPLSFDFGTPIPETNTTSLNQLDDTDGRSNQIMLLSRTPSSSGQYGNWSTYVNTAQNGWTASVSTDHTTHKLADDAYNVQKAYSACMSRNRDLNGNRVIDDNEVRWYLASLNEYIRMGIGAGAISSAAQLYIGEKSAMVKSNSVADPDAYPSAYIDEGSLFYTSSNPTTKGCYWAVERGSYGAMNEYGDGYYYSGATLPIRCIRVLPAIYESGSESQDATAVYGVQSAPIYEKKTDGSLTVLQFENRLVDDLYRARTNTSLSVHNEDRPANSFYRGILVASDYLRSNNNPTPYSLSSIIGYYGTMTNPCSTHSEGGYSSGWRVPNLVELSAMNAAGLLDANSYPVACCTQFSNSNVRYGFAYNSSGVIYCPGEHGTSDLSTSVKIKCVRDVDETYVFPDN